MSLQLPPGVVIIFDPVTHATQFIEAKGESTHERQNLSMVIGRGLAPNEMLTLRPGPLRLSIENHIDRRVLPGLWIAGVALDDLLGIGDHSLPANSFSQTRPSAISSGLTR